MGDWRRRLLGEGREAEIYEWDDGRVLRLQRDPANRPRLELEVAAIGAARSAGVPAPEVHELLEIDGRPGIVMDRVGDGGSALDAPVRVLLSAPALGRLQASLNGAAAPTDLPETRAVMRERITAVPQLTPPVRAATLALVEGLPDGDRLCHGDFHPGNVLDGPTGPVVIDWTNASRGDPDGDFARTLLLLRLAALPPGTSTWMRTADRIGRAWFRRRWERGYGKVRPVDLKAVDRWATAWAAARLWEDIDEEVEALLARVEAGLSR